MDYEYWLLVDEEKDSLEATKKCILELETHTQTTVRSATYNRSYGFAHFFLVSRLPQTELKSIFDSFGVKVHFTTEEGITAFYRGMKLMTLHNKK